MCLCVCVCVCVCVRVRVWLFYYFNFEKNYDILKSKSPCFLGINFNKNEMESKIEKSHMHFWRNEPYASAHIRIKN